MRLPAVFLLAASGVLVARANAAESSATSAAGSVPLPFTLKQDGPEWWLASPEGRRFFSMGVCLVTRGASKESFDRENPGYGSWQHYTNDRAWADATLHRLKNWNFTTIGAWSHHGVLLKSSNMLVGLTPVLHVG